MKTASKLSYIDIIHCFEASLFTITIGTQYDDYHTYHHYKYKGAVTKYVFIRKFDVFHDKNSCDCEDNTYSNCCNPLKYIGTFTLTKLFELILNPLSPSWVTPHRRKTFPHPCKFHLSSPVKWIWRPILLIRHSSQCTLLSPSWQTSPIYPIPPDPLQFEWSQLTFSSSKIGVLSYFP